MVSPGECGHSTDPASATAIEQPQSSHQRFNFADSVRVLEGPLAGLKGIIHGLDRKNQIATVLLSAVDGEMLPPLPFYYDQIKQCELFVRMRLLQAASRVGIIAVFIAFGFNSAIPWCIAVVWLLVVCVYFLWLGRKSRQLKRCPSCSGLLDSDTSYSTCTACDWVRPMPDAAKRHLEELFPSSIESAS